jgi:transcriptional regulator with XRE-family HTH domain
MNEDETYQEAIDRHHSLMAGVAEASATPAGIVGTRIRERRMERGLNQTLLGEAVARVLAKPWSKQMISAAEGGRRDLSVTELLAFAAVLGRPVQDLLAPSLTQTIKFPAGSVEGVQMRALVLGALDRGSQPLVAEIVRVMENRLQIAEGALNNLRTEMARLERLREVRP